MRDWIFSSVMSGALPANIGSSVRVYSSNSRLIPICSKRIPRLSARCRLSSIDPRDEYGLGMPTPSTFSAPSASAAMAATSAESIPPLSAITTLLKPHLRT